MTPWRQKTLHSENSYDKGWGYRRENINTGTYVLIPCSKILYYLRLAWPRKWIWKRYEGRPRCFETTWRETTMFWYHDPKYYTTSDWLAPRILILCTDTVLILCTDAMNWYCVLVLCTDTVYWYCVLIMCTDTVYCALTCVLLCALASVLACVLICVSICALVCVSVHSYLICALTCVLCCELICVCWSVHWFVCYLCVLVLLLVCVLAWGQPCVWAGAGDSWLV